MEDVAKDYESLKLLLAKDRKKKLVPLKWTSGKTSLHILCANGDLENAKSLLKHKASPTTTDNHQQTPLHLACTNGNLNLVSFLLPSSNLNAKCVKGNTPLHILASQHVPADYQSTFFTILEHMKSLGSDLNLRNNLGNTPLHCACLKGAEKIAMWLIREGADVNISNLNGENALHCAVFGATPKFISLLISVGASLNKMAEYGSVREYALKADRKDIVALIDDRNSVARFFVSVEKTITINGKEFNLEQLKSFRSQLDTVEEVSVSVSGSKSPRFRSKISPVSGVEQKISQNELLKRVIDINCTLFENEKRSAPIEPWQGIIRFPTENDSWLSEYCTIENGIIAPCRVTPFDSCRFQDATEFHVYSDNQSRFSIQENQDSPLRHFAAKHDLVPIILSILVHTTQRAIEFVDGKSLLSYIEEKNHGAIKLREKPVRSKVKRRTSLSYPTALLGGNRFNLSSTNSVKLSSSDFNQKKPMLDEKGHILCAVNFGAKRYCHIFSSQFQMQDEKGYYVFTCGSLVDIILYCFLHCGIRSLSANQDVTSFYLSYYRFCSTDELLNTIESTWSRYLEAKWPFPYDGISNETTLFLFLKGFIKSKFVLTDFETEMNFRESLASLYGKLIPKPKTERRSLAKLMKVVQKVKQTRTQTSISQLCDLKSLLGDLEGKSNNMHALDILATPVDKIAAQIISINADLYKQLQIVELLDLRYQKDKKTAVAINKVHDFSNKIYFLVPSTILSPNEPREQRDVLKKWIQIAEHVFHLRDYNSAIQIVNGITESSVVRLPHLKTLSPKWIERFSKIKEAFDPEGSFSRYRKLSTEAPSIPFIGVALKDMVFACEAILDQLEDGAINFQKLRVINDIVYSLKIEQPKQINYSFLEFDPQIAQAFLNANPLTQDELYERSKAISDVLAVPQIEQQVIILRKEIKDLQEEVKRLKQENQQKDQLITTLMKKMKSSDISLRYRERTVSSPSLPTSSLMNDVPHIRFA